MKQRQFTQPVVNLQLNILQQKTLQSLRQKKCTKKLSNLILLTNKSIRLKNRIYKRFQTRKRIQISAFLKTDNSFFKDTKVLIPKIYRHFTVLRYQKQEEDNSNQCEISHQVRQPYCELSKMKHFQLCKKNTKCHHTKSSLTRRTNQNYTTLISISCMLTTYLTCDLSSRIVK